MYLLNGLFFKTLLAQSSIRIPCFIKLKRSENERKIIISSMTSSGNSRIDFWFKDAILFQESKRFSFRYTKKVDYNCHHTNIALVMNTFQLLQSAL